MKLQSILRRFTVAQLKEAIRLSRSQGKRDKLEAEAESLRKQLAKVERKLAALDGNGVGPGGKGQGRRKGYKLSAATRNRMRIAALKRYAKDKPDAAPVAGKSKRKPFSSETRAKMRASQQARWAKVKGTAGPKAEANT